jgi:hypothetical protein
MKKSTIAVMLLFNMSIFAQEKPDILDDYKIMVGMIEDIYANMKDLKERQSELEKTFGNIRVVKKDTTVNSEVGVKVVQLEAETRQKLQNNLR